MHHKLNLSKIRRCDQIWDDMPNSEKGRACLKCKKDIIDFRKLSDEEVMNIHMFKTEPVCGIYSKDQLRYSSQKRKPYKSKTLALSIASFSLFISGKSSAQQTQVKEEVTITESHSKINILNSDKVDKYDQQQTTDKVDSLKVSGVIYDSTINEPIPGAYVVIKESKYGVPTDLQGKYHLNLAILPDSMENRVVEFGSLGYSSSRINLKDYKTDSNEINLDIFLSQDVVTMTDFGVRRYSLGRRIIRGIGKIFRKKN